MALRVETFIADTTTWSDILHEVYLRLDYPNNQTLFPIHFMTVVLPKIGGGIAVVKEADEVVGAGFLFPTRPSRQALMVAEKSGQSGQLYRCRCHVVSGHSIDWNTIRVEINRQVQGSVVFYKPTGSHTYRPTHEAVGALAIGRPSRDEAEALRVLHQTIWQSEKSDLYPVDIHSQEFGLATTLVARLDQTVVGFLFGFHKRGQSALPADWETRFQGAWRIESQVMGVESSQRGHRIGYLLKRAQGELALQQGIGIINWTADPLQFANAALNFGLLGAVSFDFYADLYPFRNQLNRVPASRLGLTWLPLTTHVRSRPIHGTQTKIVDMSTESIPVANRGYTIVHQQLDAPQIAIEIPKEWTKIQENDVDEALCWRQTTDQLFHHYIGLGEDQYTICGVGVCDQRRYLIAEQSHQRLWNRLAV
ncbi:MAG: hypothetical protein AAF702_38695 [Chloroflexota bacterium]